MFLRLYKSLSQICLAQRLQSPTCPCVVCKVREYNTQTFHLSRDLFLKLGSITRKTNLPLLADLEQGFELCDASLHDLFELCRVAACQRHFRKFQSLEEGVLFHQIIWLHYQLSNQRLTSFNPLRDKKGVQLFGLLSRSIAQADKGIPQILIPAPWTVYTSPSMTFPHETVGQDSSQHQPAKSVYHLLFPIISGPANI